MSRFAQRVGVIAGFLLSIMHGTSNAAIVNGDFSAGFAGWAGEVTDIFITSTIIDPLPGAFPANFDASSGSAVLTTSTLDDDIFSVFMFQEFVVDSVTPGNSLLLTYDLTASLSDPGFGDTAFAQLNYGTGFGSTIDLLAVSTVDVTALAGQTVELLFGVEDLDDLSDSLTVDNILITESSTVVPLPGSFVLFGSSLLGLFPFWIRRRNKA